MNHQRTSLQEDVDFLRNLSIINVPFENGFLVFRTTGNKIASSGGSLRAVVVCVLHFVEIRQPITPHDIGTIMSIDDPQPVLAC